MERLYLDNYFSIAKAQRDLGYEPLFTTEQATAECLPYYVDLFHQMKNAKEPRSARHGNSGQRADLSRALLTRAARSSRTRSVSTSITDDTTPGRGSIVARAPASSAASRLPAGRPVQLGAGGGNRLDDPLLAGNEVGAHTGKQPRAATPEQPNPVEAEVHRFAAVKPGQRVVHRRQVPLAQHRV